MLSSDVIRHKILTLTKCSLHGSYFAKQIKFLEQVFGGQARVAEKIGPSETLKNGETQPACQRTQHTWPVLGRVNCLKVTLAVLEV